MQGGFDGFLFSQNSVRRLIDRTVFAMANQECVILGGGGEWYVIGSWLMASYVLFSTRSSGWRTAVEDAQGVAI